MARGYPDFFGTPIFPNYGPLEQDDSGGFIIATGTDETLINITGKGRFYSGRLRYNGIGDVVNLTFPIITVDGDIVTYEPPYETFIYGYYLDKSRVINLVQYEKTTTGQNVVYMFCKDFLWGESLEVKLQNDSGNIITGRCWVEWAEVI